MDVMGPVHRALRDEYVRELSEASEIARREYQREVVRENAQHRGDLESAKEAVRKRLGPPAAHPRVLGVIIKYFFACQRANEELKHAGAEDYVDPKVFVHEMLSGKHQDLWEFLADLDYLPLGLRRDDTWV
jgi:hypothetical protein